MTWRAERPMGLQDISDGLLIKSGTLGAMRTRNKLPDPDGWVSDKAPWWYESTLVEWAISVGYVPPDTPRSWEAIMRQVRHQGAVKLWGPGTRAGETALR